MYGLITVEAELGLVNNAKPKKDLENFGEIVVDLLNKDFHKPKKMSLVFSCQAIESLLTVEKTIVILKSDLVQWLLRID